MIDLGPHAFFILLSYGGVAIVSLLLIIFNIYNYKKQKKRLKILEDQGISLREKRQNR